MAWTKPPLVGRTGEIERLRAAAAQSRSGERATVLVDGEAGVGKSRLVSEAVARFREPGDLLIVGHGVELSGDELPYGTVSETLGSLVREVGVDPVRAAAGEATPTLSALCPQLGDGSGSVDALRLFGGYVALAERLASNRFVWLVIEDLHWADASSRDLIRYVVRAAGPCQLLTVITVRTHDPSTDPSGSALASEWAAAADVQRITVNPLTRDEAIQQVSGLTTTTPSGTLIDRLVTLSQGNPFLIEQLMTAGLTATSEVPASVLELMMARVRQLDPATRRLVQMAALAEGNLQHGLLEQAYAHDEDTVDGARFADAIADAVDTRVLRFDSVERSYSFVHALLRQAVDSTVRPVDRLRWHRMWAELLSHSDEQVPDPRSLVAIAYHWEQAGAEPEAFDASVAAARQADRLGGLPEMATLLSRVLRLWDRVPDAAQRAGRSRDAVLSDVILTVAFSEDLSVVVALLDGEVTRTQIGDHDPLRVLCLRLTRSEAASLMENYDERLYAEALASADALLSAEPTPLLVHGLRNLGVYLSDSDPDKSFLFGGAALAAAERLDDSRLKRFVGSMVAEHLGCEGRIDEAITEYDRLLRDTVDSLTGLIELESNRGFWLYHAGRYGEAKSFLSSTLSRTSDPQLAGAFWTDTAVWLCDVLFALGEWPAEQAQLEQLELHPPPTEQGTNDLAGTAGELAIGRGDTDTANRWVETARASLPPDEAQAWMEQRKVVRFLAAQTAVACGDLREARDELAPLWGASGCERVPDMWGPLMLAAEIEADLATSGTQPGPSEDAVSVLREVAARLPKVGDLGIAWSAQVDADLTRATGRDDPAAWSAVVEAWRTVGHVPYLASSLTRLAAAHLADGDRDAAVGPLTEAFRIASDLGAEPLRDRIVELGRRGQLTLGDWSDSQRGETGRLARLTPREVEVLRLVSQGMSNSEIAEKLFISPKTASVHVSRILTKLGVNSRAKATAIAYEERLLTKAD
jgi:DNA-binding CsgD family transcriptional regulator